MKLIEELISNPQGLLHTINKYLAAVLNDMPDQMIPKLQEIRVQFEDDMWQKAALTQAPPPFESLTLLEWLERNNEATAHGLKVVIISVNPLDPGVKKHIPKVPPPEREGYSPLFYNCSRETIELLYIETMAALMHAALTKVGPNFAAEQAKEWRVKSSPAAQKRLEALLEEVMKNKEG